MSEESVPFDAELAYERSQEQAIQNKMKELQIEGWSSIGTFTNEEKLEMLNEVQRIIERRKEVGKKHNCIFCNKELESALPEGVGQSFQPYGGGEMFFAFCFGSTKFDNYMSGTSI